ncbi:hypothetical protein OG948_40035 (plasmid) [Embleya sp. NBC_00888]|uniref:hypothetical protein n=1 Tax=Embleya sp. NBC_00888 TaxID=2975960 RepID=UPI0038683C87|nr:hypothetical protein OG948_40035 [Embleya sp. NBC_00888]
MTEFVPIPLPCPSSRTLRGVRAGYVRQSSCPSDFAFVTFDFAPTTGWGDDSLWVELDPEVRIVGDALPVAYLTAFVAGIEEEWALRYPDERLVGALTITEVRLHVVDSHKGSFRMAGRKAVDAMLARLRSDPVGPADLTDGEATVG